MVIAVHDKVIIIIIIVIVIYLNFCVCVKKKVVSSGGMSKMETDSGHRLDRFCIQYYSH